MLGVGGGVIVVPILILIFRLDARLAVGTSLVMVIFTTLFLIATLLLRRSFRTATSSTRDAAKDMLSEPSNGVWRRRIVYTTAKVFEYDARLRSGLLLFFGCLASGFLRIGGGLIVVPILTAVSELPMHLAVATSMLTMIFTSISGVSTHIMLGNVAVEYALPLAVGILLGAQLGARAARHLRCATLERLCCSGLGNGSSTHHHSVVEGVTVPLSPAGLPGSL
jgi:hypothetical protein